MAFVNIPVRGSRSWRDPVPNFASLPTVGNLNGDVRVTLDTDSIWIWNGSAWVTPTGGSGTVTSVGLSLPGIFVVTGSPVTGSGTLTATLATEPANTVFAGPASGAAASPTFRALVVADLPIVDVPHGGTGLATLTANNVILGNGTSSPLFVAPGTSGNVLTSNGTTWTSAAPAASGITTIGVIDSNGASANGLTISGTTLFAQSASATNPGLVNNTTQTMSGNKTFSGQTAISNTSTTALTVNNTSLVVDATNNAIGIGQAPQSASVITTLNSSGSSKPIWSFSYGVGSTTGLRGDMARGTVLSPTATQSGDILNFISGRGYGASQFAVTSTGVMQIAANENFTNTSNATRIGFLVTHTGSVTAAEAMRINSTGNLLIGTTTDNGQLLQVGSTIVADATNSTIGINNTAPNSATFIDGINTSGATKRLLLTGYGTASLVGMRTRLARGTVGSPTAVQAGDILGFYNAEGYGTSQFPTTATGALTITAAETFTNTSNATYVTINATVTGAVTSGEHLRVTGTGVTLGPQSGSTDIHSVQGGWTETTRTINSNLTIDTTTTDYVILVNTSGGAVTVTLPTPTNGRVLIIKDSTGSFGTNNCTIARHSTEMIEGIALSKILQTNWGSTTFISDGTNWFMI